MSKARAAGLWQAPDDDVSKRCRAILERYAALLEAPQHRETSIGGEQAFTVLALNRSKAEVQDANLRLAKELLPLLREGYWTKTSPDDFRLYWQQTALIKLMLDKTLAARLTSENQRAISDLIASFFVGFSDEYMSDGMELDDPIHASEIHGSDNHDIIRRGFFLLGGQVLAADPLWSQHTFPGGFTAAQLTKRFGESTIAALKRRAATGLLAEIASPAYAGVYLQTLFVMSDHAGYSQVKDCASRYLNLIFADAAQETLGGIRGGARSRAYKTAMAYDGSEDTFLLPLFVLTGLPSSGPLWPLRLGYIPPRDAFAMLTTSYRLPKVIASLFYNRNAMGEFQYDSRRPATGVQIKGCVRGEEYPIYQPDGAPRYVRSSFVTPQYVLGWFTIDETRPTLLVHDQNEEMGVITVVPNGRIAVTGTPTSSDRRTSYSDLQAVGSSRAVLIRRNIHAYPDLPLRLFFSSDFAIARHSSGWLFAVSGDKTCWFALRAVFPAVRKLSDAAIEAADWNKDVPGAPLNGGFYTIPPKAILVLQAGSSSDSSFDSFSSSVTDVLRLSAVPTEPGLTYQPTGDSPALTLFQSPRLPEIEAKPLLLPPSLTYSSPYLQSLAGNTTVLARTPNGDRMEINV